LAFYPHLDCRHALRQVKDCAGAGIRVERADGEAALVQIRAYPHATIGQRPSVGQCTATALPTVNSISSAVYPYFPSA
jgi:hypothetical protein